MIRFISATAGAQLPLCLSNIHTLSLFEIAAPLYLEVWKHCPGEVVGLLVVVFPLAKIDFQQRSERCIL